MINIQTKISRKIVGNKVPTWAQGVIARFESELTNKNIKLDIILQMSYSNTYEGCSGLFYTCKGMNNRPTIVIYTLRCTNKKHVLAHELGHALHFFSDRADFKKSSVYAKERIADQNALNLLNNDPTYQMTNLALYKSLAARRDK